MTAAIYIFTVVFAVIGVSFAVWTFVDTRKKYYDDFLKRKSEREKLHLP
ncbi:hypothetical protein M1B34_17800 [Pseudomonas sp. MAFF 302030]|uniref:Uncharacterized protein n=1 Tax=Pseudomonas morbosilactucae TaxID=2938197 RepID=A0A9X2C7K2_9PSED|nr:hypothetical protein [Pseudomonas morbosilactucae]MCK9799508.1 hypothetical protein [Pseudomonas morbosilactucae]